MANMFKKAKEAGATASGAASKHVERIISDAKFHLSLTRLAEINKQIDELNGEAAILAGEVKETSIAEFAKLYTENGKYPGSFIIRATGMKKWATASLMFLPTDRYIKIGEERFKELVEMFGDKIAVEKTSYTMNAELVEKYGELLSDAISKIKGISDSDKDKLISAVTTFEIAKGTISDLPSFGLPISEILEEIKPVYQMKNIRVDDTIPKP